MKKQDIREETVHTGKNISVKRLTKPYSKEIEEVYQVYSKAFPIANEREPKRKFTAIAKGLEGENNALGSYVDSYLASTTLNNKVVGGYMFDYMQKNDTAFGVGWYLFVDPKYRGNNVATATENGITEMLTRKAEKRGAKMSALLGEINDPSKMSKEELEADGGIEAQKKRLVAMSKLGYKAVDPTKFEYVQPQLTKSTDSYEGLYLVVKPFRQDWQEKIPVSDLKDMLRTYTWAGFEGIPGSDIDGYRNPDTDRTYQRMEKQLVDLEKHGTKYLNLKSLM